MIGGVVALAVVASVVVTFLPWPFGPLSGACADIADRTGSLPGERDAEILDVTGTFSALPLGVDCTVTSSSGLVTTASPDWALTILVAVALGAAVVAIVRWRTSRDVSRTDG